MICRSMRPIIPAPIIKSATSSVSILAARFSMAWLIGGWGENLESNALVWPVAKDLHDLQLAAAPITVCGESKLVRSLLVNELNGMFGNVGVVDVKFY